MHIDNKVKAMMLAYEGVWLAITPLLKANRRLKSGYAQRCLKTPLPGSDLWIQAASGGEAYIAESILKELKPASRTAVLVTTNTLQGMEILARAKESLENQKLVVNLSYFPFDMPSLARKALAQTDPALTVLVETEIWPGLLYAHKAAKKKIIIVNGRITDKSQKGYRMIRGLLKKLSPDHILAISQKDAQGFARIFGPKHVEQMNNIKFDQLDFSEKPGCLPEWIPGGLKFVVLGSVRSEEEKDVLSIIEFLLSNYPDIVIGLFPRHMERINAWADKLLSRNKAYKLRSSLSHPPQPGSVILWDRFGELNHAYRLANAVFVGGSLAPLGGQNFIEPLAAGIIPVIGPFWDNFSWVGSEIFEQGLCIKENNWKGVAKALGCILQNPADRQIVKNKAFEYIARRQGGTRQACRVIEKYLAGK